MKLNYNESIVSLSNSFLKYYTNTQKHSTLKELDDVLNKQKYKNVIFLLFDGLGSSNLDICLEKDKFLQINKLRDISSTFPPTTASATTSFMSAMYFKEVDEYINIFPNTTFKNVYYDKLITKEKLKFENIFELINKSGTKTVYLSSFGDYLYDGSLEDGFSKLENILNTNEDSFIYMYNSLPDSYMHEKGIHDKKVIETVNYINDTLEALTKKHPDTLFVVSADHGHVDVTELYLEDYSEFTSIIKGNCFCEPRCLGFNIEEKNIDLLKDVYNKYFKDDFLLLTKKDILEKQMFGLEVSDKLDDYLADYYLVATTYKAILPKNLGKVFKGHHAGFLKEEITIPLIVINA